MHYHSNNTKTTKFFFLFFNDIMMMSLSSPRDEQTWFGLKSPGSSWRRKKKFPTKKLCIFDEKQSNFHPQTLIFQSKQKKKHKNA